MTRELFSLARSLSLALPATRSTKIVPLTDHAEDTDARSLKALACRWAGLCLSDGSTTDSNAFCRWSWLPSLWHRDADCTGTNFSHTVAQLVACLDKHRRLFGVLSTAMKTSVLSGSQRRGHAASLAGLCHDFLAELDAFFSCWAPAIPFRVQFHALQLIGDALAVRARLATACPMTHVDVCVRVLLRLAPCPTPHPCCADDDTHSVYAGWAAAAFTASTGELLWWLDNATHGMVYDCFPDAVDALANWAIHQLRAQDAPRRHGSSDCPACAATTALNTLSLLCGLDGGTASARLLSKLTRAELTSALMALAALPGTHASHDCRARRAVDELLEVLPRVDTPRDAETTSSHGISPRAVADDTHDDSDTSVCLSDAEDTERLAPMLRSMHGLARARASTANTEDWTDAQRLAAHAVSAYLDSFLNANHREDDSVDALERPFSPLEWPFDRTE